MNRENTCWTIHSTKWFRRRPQVHERSPQITSIQNRTQGSSPGTGALQGIVDLENGNFLRTCEVVLEKFTSPSHEIYKFHGAIDTRDEYPIAFRLFVILLAVLPRLQASLNFLLCKNNRERKTTRAAQRNCRKNTADYLDTFKRIPMLKRLERRLKSIM